MKSLTNFTLFIILRYKIRMLQMKQQIYNEIWNSKIQAVKNIQFVRNINKFL